MHPYIVVAFLVIGIYSPSAHSPTDSRHSYINSQIPRSYWTFSRRRGLPEACNWSTALYRVCWFVSVVNWLWSCLFLQTSATVGWGLPLEHPPCFSSADSVTPCLKLFAMTIVGIYPGFMSIWHRCYLLGSWGSAIYCCLPLPEEYGWIIRWRLGGDRHFTSWVLIAWDPPSFVRFAKLCQQFLLFSSTLL